MPCSSCGGRRAVVSESQAAAIVNQRRIAKYVVTDPRGIEPTLETTDYQEATNYKRKIHGTLTTSTA